MKLVAMLRVKNQILTIHDCLSKLSELVDEIVIVDNGSTDGTLTAYKKYPKIVVVKKTSGYHEGRDKILAHKLAKTRHPDWILWIDADEIFEDSVTRNQLNQYMSNPGLEKVEFRMFNFWRCKTHYRVDGIWRRYTAFPQRHMWKNISNAYFRNLKLHNGGIMGIMGKHTISHIRLKHFGYVWPQQFKTKTLTYNRLQNHPRSTKTLSLEETNIKLSQWHESSSAITNRYYQFLSNTYWNFTQFRYNLLYRS